MLFRVSVIRVPELNLSCATLTQKEKWAIKRVLSLQLLLQLSFASFKPLWIPRPAAGVIAGIGHTANARQFRKFYCCFPSRILVIEGYVKRYMLQIRLLSSRLRN